MPYSKDESGLLNNFASEPKMYVAEPPTKSQKRSYLLTIVAAVILIGGLITVAYLASQAA
ncbi:photosystem II assembly protein Psb34 [Leptolyngbya sp. FACHB-261]|uniref:photosystem II assembly protein Psb34 n=1 Tax=Leptolyngbya sp. FACHB-261 TaxID=2692806 RepID=UPI0016851C49|nr:ssl1498 family light-harvesting-like protein [Leptolyngbya sp. FACHB-261]MBD2102352.1 ssl1498 family light-harvesting-like protein [Leptolyngbya sp. FACHB-261]